MTPHHAEQIARAAHAGQVKHYGGGDYIDHVARVAALVYDWDDAKVVAWLHDVLEDTAVTAEALAAAGATPTQIEAVRLLTRLGESYAVYLANMAAAPGVAGALARLVKWADLEDHLTNNAAIPASLRRRYVKAQTFLAAWADLDVATREREREKAAGI